MLQLLPALHPLFIFIHRSGKFLHFSFLFSSIFHPIFFLSPFCFFFEIFSSVRLETHVRLSINEQTDDNRWKMRARRLHYRLPLKLQLTRRTIDGGSSFFRTRRTKRDFFERTACVARLNLVGLKIKVETIGKFRWECKKYSY